MTKHHIISVPIQNQTKLRSSIHCWEVMYYLMETPLLMIQAVEQTILQGMSCEVPCVHAHVRCLVARVLAKSILKSVRNVRVCGSF